MRIFRPELEAQITDHQELNQQENQKMKKERDIEKTYSTAEFIAKLRRLADALEAGEKFEIQIANERIYVPVRATYSIEHERGEIEEEIEFQIKWEND